MKHYRLIFGILLGVAIALRIYIVTLDMNILLDQGLVQDDAFYYYVIANNLLAHGVPSFDGINATNGFHPLWQLICLPVFSVLESDHAVRTMLAISCAFDILAILLFCRILRELKLHDAAILFALAVLGLHGTIIRTWFNGLETALGLACLLWFVFHWLDLVMQNNDTNLGKHYLLGLATAIAFLARTDNAVIMLVMLLFLYVPRLLRAQFIPAIASGAVCIALISPWLLTNLVYFGSIVQVSGQLSGDVWLVGGVQNTNTALIDDVLFGVLSSVYPLGNVFKKMFIPGTAPDLYGYPFLLAMLAAAIIVWRKDLSSRHHLKLIIPFVLGVFMLFFYHAGVRHFMRGWYNAPILLVFTLLLCIFLDAALRYYRSPHIASVTVIAVVMALLVFYSPHRYTRSSGDPATDPRVLAATWLSTRTPVDTLVGSANAGIIGFHARRPVINLDGVVNAKALEARMEDQLHAYIHRSGIDYLADHKGSIAHLCATNTYYQCEIAGSWDGGIQVMKVVNLSNAMP